MNVLGAAPSLTTISCVCNMSNQLVAYQFVPIFLTHKVISLVLQLAHIHTLTAQYEPFGFLFHDTDC